MVHRLLTALSAVFACAAIVLAALLWRQHRAHDLAAQQLSVANDQLAQIRKQYRARQNRGVSMSLGGSPAARPAETPAAVELKRMNTELDQRRSRRNALNGEIAGLDALHLSADQLARAKQLIVDRWHAPGDAVKDPRTAGALRAAATAAQKPYDEKLIALLGADGYAVVEASDREGRLDWTIGTDMWDGGAPLTPEQLHSLALTAIGLKYDASPWSFPAKPDQIPDPQTGLSPADTEFLAASAAYLSSAQQQILRRTLIEDQQYNAAMRGFSEKQRRAYKAAGGN